MACTHWLHQHLAPLSHEAQGGRRAATLVCGMGNNGGDGLAIARLLKARGWEPRVVLVHHAPAASADNEVNQERTERAGLRIHHVRHPVDLAGVERPALLVDALLGSGVSRPLQGIASEVVKWMNASGAPIVAIDLPSGLHGDGLDSGDTPIVQATWTLCLEAARPALFFRENERFLGEWTLVPIGSDQGFIAGLGAKVGLTQASDVRSLLRTRRRFDHKGDHGHGLIIAGMTGRMGAAVLAVRSCLRSGVGLCTAHVPAQGLHILQAAAPEAMCTVDGSDDHLSALPQLASFTSIGIGPGIGTHADTAQLLKLLIQEAQVPLVVDADGLNLLAENKTWLAFLPPGTILTPHPKEFDRLAGPSVNSQERLARARDMAVKWRCVIVLKGAFSAICDPSGQVRFNPTGNPGMAKGGSGDVLTGLLTGLLAQRLSPLDAAVLGVYLHGLAGDMAAFQLGMDAMKSGDIIEHLPAAFQRLREVPGQSSPSTSPLP